MKFSRSDFGMQRFARRRLKRGVFRSVDELKAAINRFFAKTNANPKPSSGPPIPTVLAAVKRGNGGTDR